MSYLPQYNWNDETYACVPPANAGAWQVVTPGSGYISADVGKTVTLIGGTPGVAAATAVIASVAGGGITGFAPYTANGDYSNLYTGQPWGVSGGSGSGCTVNVGGDNVAWFIDHTGLGAAVGQSTLFTCINGYVFDPGLVMFGYQGGVNFTFNTGQQEGYDDPFLLLTLRDGAAATILDARFTPPGASIMNWTPATSFYNVLLAFNTSTRTIEVYVNDLAWVMDPTSAGWSSANPVANAYSALDNWRIWGMASIAQLYLRPAFTDLTVTANRRVFLNADNSIVDPSTYPVAPVNLYFLPGSQPSAFTNQGTGGAWQTIGALTSYEPAFFDLEYHGVNFARTPVNTPVTLDLTTTGFGTVRPGATLTMTLVPGRPPQYGGQVTLDGQVLTYTPPAGYVGFDYPYLDRIVTMPAGYVSPLVWAPDSYWGVDCIIAIGLATANEAGRASVDVVTMPYIFDVLPSLEYYSAYMYQSRAVFFFGTYDTWSADGNTYINTSALFGETSPTARVYTQYGGADPSNGDWSSDPVFGVWGGHVCLVTTRTPDGTSDLAYGYMPYSTGAAGAAFVWTEVSVASLGFSSNWQQGPIALAWQDLIDPVAVAFDYNSTTNKFDAYVVSPAGAQTVTGFMTFPYTYNWSSAVLLIYPDAAHGCNWVLYLDDYAYWHNYCFSSLDGSQISHTQFTFEDAEIEEITTDGITSTGGNSVFNAVTTAYGFEIYGPMNRFQQSGKQNVLHRKGDFRITLTPDCTSYTVQFLDPTLDDATAMALLNHTQSYLTFAFDAAGTPYLVGYDAVTETDGMVLSLVAPSFATPPNPLCGPSTANSITTTWGAVSGASSYTVQWSADGVSWTAVPSITGTSYQILRLQPATAYQWQVQAVGGGGTSGWTAVTTCTTTALPAPLPQEPAEMGVWLSWSDDRGHRWSDPVMIGLGDVGKYNTNLQWRRLGFARSRVFRLEWTAPVPTVLLGASIDVIPGAS